MAETPDSGSEQTAAAAPSPDPWSNSDSWIRLLLTVVYFIIFWLSLWLLGLAVVINLGALIFTGSRNEGITGFTRQLIEYQRQMALFASQASHRRPFPFGEPLPAQQPSSEEDAQPVPEPEPPAAAPAETAEPVSEDTAPASKKKRTKKPATRKKRKKKTAKRVSKPEAASAASAADQPEPETEPKTEAENTFEGEAPQADGPAVQPPTDDTNQPGDDNR